ncbi:hypothetical protein JHK86_015804 [Glycine max]|nr:hypothetical protein JHK86_015804 [Glycine max]
MPDLMACQTESEIFTMTIYADIESKTALTESDHGSDASALNTTGIKHVGRNSREE